MEFELRPTDSEAVSSRRLASLHLLLAFVLCAIGANGLVMYWFRGQLQAVPADFSPVAIFGLVSFLAGLMIFAMFLFNRRWLMRGRRSLIIRVVEIVLLLASTLLFLRAGQTVPVIVFGIITALIGGAAIWEFRLPKFGVIRIDQAGIAIPKGGLQKLIGWDRIERVILRHGILSIELEGNKLLQHPVTPAGINIEALEQFCAAQAAAHAGKRAANAAW